MSGQVRELVAALRALGREDGPRCVLTEGGGGSGKSLAAAAFQAACQASGINVILVNEGSDPGEVMRRAGDGDALVVDNLDRLSAGLRRALFERRHSAAAGTLLTAARTSALERELLGPDDSQHVMGRWEERPSDVLILAALAWRDLGLRPDLPDLCGEGVAEALGGGPWTDGAHSVRRVVTLLAEALALEGYSERTSRSIEVADVLSAMISVIREQRAPEQEDVIRIVVEGATDGTYLEAAAGLARESWGVDLLAGCRVAAPGEDREGGAEKAARELIVLEAQGVTAVALFDDDEPGRTAARDARRYTNQKVHLLPAEFDPLNAPQGTGKIEIEDLVTSTLLQRFYEANPELEPEESTTRGTRVRTVVAGPDKELAAAWICEHASFEDMERIVYTLCMIRQSLGLPLPDACPPLREWMRRLES